MDNYMEIFNRMDYLVVKGNELIQKNRFELSLPEQKTVAFICSMIKPVEKPVKDGLCHSQNIPYQLEYDFDIRDYCKVCDIDYNNGKIYTDIKATLKHLSDRSMWITFPENPNEEVLCRWLSKVRIKKRSGIVHIELDKDLAPYLFDLGQKFTQYQLYNILAMKSAFSVRIYELMKSYAFQGSKVFDLDELKHLLMVENVKSYKNFKDFRVKVLEKAQTEINRLTDIDIDFKPIIKGKKVVKVEFQIIHKNPVKKMPANVNTTNSSSKLK